MRSKARGIMTLIFVMAVLGAPSRVFAQGTDDTEGFVELAEESNTRQIEEDIADAQKLKPKVVASSA